MLPSAALSGAAILAWHREQPQSALVWAALAAVALALGWMARRRAAALVRHANRLEDQLDQAPCAMALTDVELRLTACNARFAELAGCQAADLIGRDLYDVLQTTDADDTMARLDAVCRGTGNETQFDICLMSRGAHTSCAMWVEVRASRFSADASEATAFGAIGGLRLALWDVSARQAREARLMQRQQVAVSSAQLGFWEWDVANRRLDISPRWADIVGYTVDELPADLSVIDMLAHPDDRVPFRDKLIPHLRGDTTDFVLEHRLRHKWGFWVWVRDTGLVVERDRAGRATRMIGVYEDITAVRHAEAALTQSQQKQSLAMQGAKLGMWDWHVPTGEAVFSARWAEIAGFRIDELEPHISTWERLVHPDDWSALREQLEPQLRGDTDEYSFEHRVLHKDGHWVWVLDTGKVLERDDAGNALRLVGLYQDISARKADELELKRAKEAADAANRAKSEFLANMSHEIRTPMNAIIGLSQVVLGTELMPRQRDYLQKVHASSKALLGVLNDILDYSKIEAGCMAIEQVTFALEEPLKNVANLFGAQVEQKGLELYFEMAPDAPREVIGDPLRLSQVLNNLVGNAIKFTEQGVIHVKAEVAARDDTGYMLRIAVADTGIGLSRAQSDRLFQAFMQADNSITRKYGGTGLGLSISHRLVTLMGGQIAVSGQEGKGCTFTFTVRVGRAPHEELNMNIHEVRGLRALVVDDQETSRLIMGNMFESWGVHVDTAGSAIEGLQQVERARESGNPYDVLLLDWRMPEMSGLEMAARMRAQAGADGRPPFAIMVTAYGQEQLIEESGTVPVDLVLTKPVAPSNLFDVMMRLRRPGAPARTKPISIEAPLALHERTTFPGAHVLLVEDNPLNQDVAREFLSGIGIEVTVANHGGEAVRLIEQHTYDLVLMDMHMPIMDGLEATRRIRELRNGKGLPVIAMTAAVMIEDRDKCTRVGMADFVAKPVDPDDLVRMLHAWLPRKAPVAAPGGAASLPPGANGDALSRSLRAPGSPVGARSAAKRFRLTLDGFECDLALRRLHGNADRLRELLIDFARRHADTAPLLQAMSQAGQTEELMLLAHSIKGAASNLGLIRQAALAQEVESAARAGSYPVPVAHFAQALEESLRAIATLHEARAATARVSMAVDKDDVVRLLNHLGHYLREQELVPDTLLDELRVLSRDEALGDTFAQLDQQIFNFEHDAALAGIGRIAAVMDLALEG